MKSENKINLSNFFIYNTEYGQKEGKVKYDLEPSIILLNKKALFTK
jgi:hypothetical protein